MKELLDLYLDKKRKAHSLATAEMAVELAKRFGADEKKAYTAGLLHDIAKGFSPEKMIEQAEFYGIEITPVEQVNTELLHGPVAAQMVKEQAGITDEDIINAIRYHTTGRAGMSLLEKIIYVADVIEPNRTFLCVPEVRLAAERDLDLAVHLAAKRTLSYVVDRGLAVHPFTVDVFNERIIGGFMDGI